MTEITNELLQEITQLVEMEFPNDPALQEIHFARKVLALKAKSEGMEYWEYVRSQVNKPKAARVEDIS